MASETDGFEIQRPGSKELDITIQLHLYNNPHKFKCSKKLENIIGTSLATRTTILTALWEYVKINRLQDQEFREIINCDSALKDLFECEKVPINQILGKIKGHLSNPDPIEIHHRIKLGDIKDNEQVYDIKVEFDYPFSLEILPFFSKHVSAAEEKVQNQGGKVSDHPFLQIEQKLKRFDKKQLDYIEKIKRHSYKRDSFSAYSEDPLPFIDGTLMQQNSLLKILNSNNLFKNLENPENPEFLLNCEDYVYDEIRKQVKQD